MNKVHVHPRIKERHPILDEEDVLHAFENYEICRQRLDKESDEHLGFGFDAQGRAIEFVAVRDNEGDWLIYHALTPLSENAKRELGLGRKKNEQSTAE